MTKILSLDEMREVITSVDAEAGARYTALMEAIGNIMVADICKRFDLTTSKMGATADHHEIGGTAAPFYRKSMFQVSPPEFDDFDPDEEIEVDPRLEHNDKEDKPDGKNLHT